MTASAPGGPAAPGEPQAGAEANDQFRAFVELLPGISYATTFAPGFPLTYVSPQLRDILGYDPADFLADQGFWYRVIHADDLATVRAQEARLWTEGRGDRVLHETTFRMIASDGREVWMHELQRVVRDDEGRPVSTTGVLVDISVQRAAQEAARSGEELNRSIVAALDEGVVVIDREGRYVEANASAARISGIPVDEILGSRAPLPGVDLRYEDGVRVTPRNAPESLALRDGTASREVVYRLVRRDGTERWVSANYQPLPGAEGAPPRGVVCSLVDITERRAAERQIADLAYHDPLTGLPNRALLEEHLALQLALARRSGRALAVLYLDLDDFKLVNDGFGHAAGDDLLRWVAARLQRRIRAGDLLARQGGDEFLLLAADLGEDAPSAAAALAADLATALHERFELSGASFHVGVSIGISVFPDDARDADSLLRHADAAMYQAKRSGRGRAAMYTEATEDPRERLSRASRLREAIARGELALHYQPIFSLPALELHGLEALVRWRDPDRGLLAPADFVPLAESTDLVDALGDWVVDEACRQTREWRAAGLAAPVSFNVSVQQLRRDGFAARLGARLERAGVDPSWLTAEITESAAGDPVVADHGLDELRSLGLNVVLDDFGAGYSSLDRVRRLPVSCVKIDRSFLAEIPDSPDACAMVVAILGLARSLGLDAVAEGVETRAQLEFLVREDCGFAQGFYLASPVPAGEIAAAVAAGAARRPAGARR